jgi:hypothetical protein
MDRAHHQLHAIVVQTFLEGAEGFEARIIILEMMRQLEGFNALSLSLSNTSIFLSSVD